MYPTTEISRRRSPRPFPGRGSRPLSGLHHAEGLDVGEPRRAIPQSEEGTLGPYARTTAVRTPLAARRALLPLPPAPPAAPRPFFVVFLLLFAAASACRCCQLPAAFPLLPAAVLPAAKITNRAIRVWSRPDLPRLGSYYRVQMGCAGSPSPQLVPVPLRSQG
jgi:hypothetical protein